MGVVVLSAVVESIERIEPSECWCVRPFIESLVPLSDGVGGIAELFQDGGESGFVQGETLAFLRQENVVLKSIVRWISTCQNGLVEHIRDEVSRMLKHNRHTARVGLQTS